ncbi:hypothetical protein FTUN_5116 [Frigoriglobus tundricola]|uniref:Uncharacterized protein n=1 Tax=Frigoriglobus tundricola TaxID=2774151 RepID=A0A6M5YW54_9BACT|nr:hypothetical protein FTUN_5116 [Frigoriglobus tundricola]
MATERVAPNARLLTTPTKDTREQFDRGLFILAEPGGHSLSVGAFPRMYFPGTPRRLIPLR